VIVRCASCSVHYDDEFRYTFCPHDTFLANDGQNNFRHYPESYRDPAPVALGEITFNYVHISSKLLLEGLERFGRMLEEFDYEFPEYMPEPPLLGWKYVDA
jgi:hypothetical protein